MKIVTIVGARPQFVKTATVSKQLREHKIQEVMIHTGQHFDDNMSQLFFNELDILKPKYNLNINNLPHGALTGRMLEQIENILLVEKPDWVIIYGDTDSTLAGALAAKKLNIKLAHIEAGLRSHNEKMAEETNRIVADRISDLLFCPTITAANNLLREGVSENKIIVCGDVMKDSVLHFMPKMQKPAVVLPEKYAVCTIHRAENINNKNSLLNILLALDELCSTIDVVCPLHPHTKNIISKFNIETDKLKIKFIEPVGYLEMLYLLHNSSLVLTDSGGLQKEAFMLGKFCITLRNETEWVELVDNGCNVLVGDDPKKIIGCSIDNIGKIIDLNSKLYGNGDASKMIVQKLKEYIQQ